MKPIEVLTIKLDKERPFILGMGALMRAERMINRRRQDDGEKPVWIFSLINDALAGARTMEVSVQFAVILIWAGVNPEDPDEPAEITLGAVAKSLRSPLKAVATVFAALSAYFSSVTDDEEAGEAERPLDPPLNGVASAPSPDSTSS